MEIEKLDIEIMIPKIERVVVEGDCQFAFGANDLLLFTTTEPTVMKLYKDLPAELERMAAVVEQTTKQMAEAVKVLEDENELLRMKLNPAITTGHSTTFH